MRKYNRVIEYVWLVFGFASLGLSIEAIYSDGWDHGKIFLIAPAIAFMWYFTRRFTRRKLEGETFRKAEEEAQLRKAAQKEAKKQARQNSE